MALRLITIFAALLFSFGPPSVAKAGSMVLEIDCGTSPFTEQKKCAGERAAGAELEIIVNPSTQKVQISVTKNSGHYFGNVSFFLEHCSVVDASNWLCKDENRSAPNAQVQIELMNEYGMHNGHYYHSLTGGLPPHYYHSSISGWRYWAYQIGLVDLDTAESYD